jgi:hypothetical protein
VRNTIVIVCQSHQFFNLTSWESSIVQVWSDIIISVWLRKEFSKLSLQLLLLTLMSQFLLLHSLSSLFIHKICSLIFLTFFEVWLFDIVENGEFLLFSKFPEDGICRFMVALRRVNHDFFDFKVFYFSLRFVIRKFLHLETLVLP